MTNGARPRRGRLPAAVLGATALLSAARARGEARDPWFGRDKALHFGASALIASGGYGGAALLTEDRRLRLAAGGGLALTAGVAKELWDLSGHGDPSWRDLAWDAAGTATGLAVALAIDWAVGKLSRGPARATP